MEHGFVILKNETEIVGQEACIGNACELQMVMQEAFPNDTFDVREFVGCIIESN